MKYKERWERAKREMRAANEQLRRESKEIEFKRSQRVLGPGMRTLLWVSIIINVCIAAALAVTIVGMPLSVIMLIGSIYVYQTYLRRGE